VTLDEVELEIGEHEARIAELRAVALRLPEVRSMPGAWVRSWLESHGASPQHAQREILAVLNERRAANDQPPVGTCARRQPWI
jgi:hypothetical protein